MKLPRLTIHRLMAAVAALALLIALEKAAIRPIPVAGAFNPTSNETYWSDGVVASGDKVPWPVETSDVLLCRLVRWTDGSVGFRLPGSLVEQSVLLLMLLLFPAAIFAGIVKLFRNSRKIASLEEEDRRIRAEIDALEGGKIQ